MKICLVSSHGGHLTELLRLMSAFKNHKVYLIVHKDDFTYNMRCDSISKYLIPVFFRLPLLLVDMIIISIYEIFFLVKERPNVIISTGAEIAIPIFILSKMFGIKTIYIESMARLNDISTTGKILIRIADIFLVQWVGLTTKYKKAKYAGKIL